MITKLDDSGMVQGSRQGPELGDSGQNPINEDQTEYREKVHNNSDKKMVVPYQQKKEKTFAHVKNDQPFSKTANQTRVLFAESETEILLLFKEYFELIGTELVTTDNGDKALNIFQADKKGGKNYDIVVLDTHLNGTRGLDVAKKIHTTSPNQRIVLLTTSPKDELSQETLNSTAIEDKDILVMPFKLSQFRTIINQ